MKVDWKSVLLGLLLGAAIMFAGAARRGDGSGIISGVPAGGKAVVKRFNGEAFVIDIETAMAKRVLFKKPEPGEPRYPGNINGRPLMLAD